MNRDQNVSISSGGKIMPIRPRKGIASRGSAGLTEATYMYFAFGRFFEAEDYEVGKTAADLRALWNKHRGAIMARYSEANRLRGKHFAGRRPWAYMKWDRTEPRILATDLTPEDLELKKNGLVNHKKFRQDGLEADLPYLKRLGLLEAWELEAL